MQRQPHERLQTSRTSENHCLRVLWRGEQDAWRRVLFLPVRSRYESTWRSSLRALRIFNSKKQDADFSVLLT